MRKKMLVTIEVELADWTEEEKRADEELAMCSAEEMPGVADYDPPEIGDAIAGSLTINGEIFAGTGMYMHIHDATLLSAKWSE